MACCCNPGGRSNKSASSCLGRCDLPKHRCLHKEDVKPGPVPRHMGWLYTAKDAPEHQLRCGWRPGHISCKVLRKIEQHNCLKFGECTPCSSTCSRPPCPKPCLKPCYRPCSKPCFKPCCSNPCSRTCSKPCCAPPKCVAVCPPNPSCCKPPPPCCQPLIRIIRHGGQYSISTKPSNISNAPSGQYPLKYVLNTSNKDSTATNAKYSVEAKFNDYHFDYTSSQSSFVLDFSPPEQKCYKPCPKKSVLCMLCSVEDSWPAAKNKKSDKDVRECPSRSCCRLSCPDQCSSSVSSVESLPCDKLKNKTKPKRKKKTKKRPKCCD